MSQHSAPPAHRHEPEPLWMRRANDVASFVVERGRLPGVSDELGVWVTQARRNRYRLPSALLTVLNGIPGWWWLDELEVKGPDAARVAAREIVAFYNEHGRFPLVSRWPDGADVDVERRLYSAMTLLRQRYRAGTLGVDEARIVGTIDEWFWTVSDRVPLPRPWSHGPRVATDYNSMLLAAVRVDTFVTRHGRIPVAGDDAALCAIVESVRHRYATNLLADGVIAAFSQVTGWWWPPIGYSDVPGQYITAQEIAEHYRAQGRLVPPGTTTLAARASALRKAHVSGLLDDGVRAILDAIPGWWWSREQRPATPRPHIFRPADQLPDGVSVRNTPPTPARPAAGWSGLYESAVTTIDKADLAVPASPSVVSFSAQAAARIAGITYRQLDYWARTGLVVPSLDSATGSGSRRSYAHRDLLTLRAIKMLLDTGISLESLRNGSCAVHIFNGTELPPGRVPLVIVYEAEIVGHVDEAIAELVGASRPAQHEDAPAGSQQRDHPPYVTSVTLPRPYRSAPVVFDPAMRNAERVVEFNRATGRLPGRSDNRALSTWIEQIRRRHANGEVSAEVVAVVEQIQLWSWVPVVQPADQTTKVDDVWTARAHRIAGFVAANGRLPGADQGSFGKWTSQAKNKHRAGTLTTAAVEAFERIPIWRWLKRDDSDAWRLRVQQITAFVERTGRQPISSEPLGSITRRARQAYRDGALNASTIAGLEQLDGWWWNRVDTQLIGSASPAIATTAQRLNELQTFLATHDAPPRWRAETLPERSLAVWLSGIVKRHYQGTLPAALQAQVAAIHPDWLIDRRDILFRSEADRYRAWCVEHRRHPGSMRRHRDDSSAGVLEDRLHLFAQNLRKSKSREDLAADRVAVLEQIPGWEWSIDWRHDKWERRWRDWVAFVAEQQREPTRGRADGDKEFESSLATWVTDQRRRRRSGTLPDALVVKLGEHPQWQWALRRTTALDHRATWDESHDALVEWYRHDGNAPRRRDDPRLFTWAANQRSACHGGRLSSDRIARLEQVAGWSWGNPSGPKRRWLDSFRLVEQFMLAHHRMPAADDDVDLARWCANQRRMRDTRVLSDASTGRLELLPGWSWLPASGAATTPRSWDLAVEAYRSFVAVNGRRPVRDRSDGTAEESRLANWLSLQRAGWRRGELTDVRREQIADLLASHGTA